MSIPAPVMRQFEAAREQAVSHTALVLDALRAHATDLTRLVESGRPVGPSGDDLFPFRPPAAKAVTRVRPEQLRVRPTVGELAVIDSLVAGVNERLLARRPGDRRASRSEVVAAALAAYLPTEASG